MAISAKTVGALYTKADLTMFASNIQMGDTWNLCKRQRVFCIVSAQNIDVFFSGLKAQRIQFLST